MEEKKELRLGERVTYEGKIYECRFQFECEGCAFNIGDEHNACCKPTFFGHCSCMQRVDNRDVIFVEIGDEKPAVPKTEFALDEEFRYGLKTLRCVKSKNPAFCEGCYFEGQQCDPEEIGNCMDSSRSDGEYVIFVEVKPENKEK